MAETSFMLNFGGPGNIAFTEDSGIQEILKNFCERYYLFPCQTTQFYIEGYENLQFTLYETWPHVFIKVTLTGNYADPNRSKAHQVYHAVEVFAKSLTRNNYSVLNNNCVTVTSKLIQMALQITSSKNGAEANNTAIQVHKLPGSLHRFINNHGKFRITKFTQAAVESDSHIQKFTHAYREALAREFCPALRRATWKVRMPTYEGLARHCCYRTKTWHFRFSKRYSGDRTLHVLQKAGWLKLHGGNYSLGEKAPEAFRLEFRQKAHALANYNNLMIHGSCEARNG